MRDMCKKVNKVYYTELSKDKYSIKSNYDKIELFALNEFCRQMMHHKISKYHLYNLCKNIPHEHKYSESMCNRCILCFKQNTLHKECRLEYHELKSYWCNVQDKPVTDYLLKCNICYYEKYTSQTDY